MENTPTEVRAAKMYVCSTEEGRAEYAGDRRTYGASQTCWSDLAECMICTETRVCFHVDTSDGEYEYAAACLDCIKRVLSAGDAALTTRPAHPRLPSCSAAPPPHGAVSSFGEALPKELERALTLLYAELRAMGVSVEYAYNALKTWK